MPTEGITYRSAAGRWVLAVATTGSGMAFLDSTIANVALPTIGRDLGASRSLLQWIISGYILTLASLILLGDRFGRRRMFVVVAWAPPSVPRGACHAAPLRRYLRAGFPSSP